MSESQRETWCVSKPAVHSDRGLVVSQHAKASEIGAAVLRDGGNAVDAAVATGFALGVLEPWMSGIGGCGYLLVYLAASNEWHAVDFGVRASAALDPADYPLREGVGPDLFQWQSVLDDRNVSGPYSVAVPGHVAGLATALDRFGTRPFAELMAPAIELADAGLAVDWFASLKIASAAPMLSRYTESRRVYLPGGFAPVGEWGGPVPILSYGSLNETLRRLADAGPRDFYEGEIAARILDDANALGIRLTPDDLSGYNARVTPIETFSYRDATIGMAPGLTAGPTFRDALGRLEQRCSAATSSAPNAEYVTAYAEALTAAYAQRLATLGDHDDSRAPACTSHISVADRDGNLVALTQTLLSIFGSKVVLPQTGILMNNGVMWFDPRPGRPNSIAPGKRPLSNMCPALVIRADGSRYALGASGGRRIMPAVLQLTSGVIDFGMSVDCLLDAPRIDVGGSSRVTVDDRFDDSIIAALRECFSIDVVQNRVYPNYFACPNVVGYDPAARRTSGAAFIMSPWAGACAEPD